MDLKRFGCHVDPFAEAPDRRFFYFDALRRRIRAEIMGSLGRSTGFIVLAGETGAGKTTMLHCLSEAIDARADCYLLSSVPWLTCRQGTTLRELAEVFSYARRIVYLGAAESDAQFGAGLASCDRDGLARGPGGKSVAVVVLDDAHRLAPQVVVQLRRWRTAFQSVRGPLSIILTTCPEKGATEAGALADSGDVVSRLCPLNRNGVQHLIHHRLRAAGYEGTVLFPPEAVARIFDHAKGNPLKTVRLCHRALALAPDGCGDISIATIDAAAQMEFSLQPDAMVDAVFFQPSAISHARFSDLPPAPDIPEAPFTGADASDCASSLGARKVLGARLLRLASTTASMITVLAVGWFYIAERDGGVNPIAVLEAAVSSGMSAAVTLVPTPGKERPAPDVPVEAPLLPQFPHPPEATFPPVQAPRLADAESDLFAPDRGETLRHQPAVAPDTEPMAVASEPLEPQEEAAPSVPHSEPLASEPLEPEAIESGQTPAGWDAPSGFAGPAVNELLDRGNSLLELGDIAAARLFYDMASERGSAEGAMLMGLTFDPVYFERKGIYGTRPDVFEAMEWYRKSASMGNVAAEEHMSALELWLRWAAQEGDEEARHALRLLVRP